jgi:hypothetical protein
MSAGTFTLPDGSRVRTNSQRRYVAFRKGQRGWRVVKRSDHLVVLRNHPQVHYGDRLVDTHTGEVVR